MGVDKGLPPLACGVLFFSYPRHAAAICVICPSPPVTHRSGGEGECEREREVARNLMTQTER